MSDEFEVDGLTVRIEPDPDPLDPRKEFDRFGTMVCWHRRYNLGDKQTTDTPYEFWWGKMQEMHLNIPDDISREHLERWRDKHYCVLPLYLYDHSGLSMNTTGFSCGWDSSHVGFIYLSLEKASKEYGLQKWTDVYEPTGLTLYQQCEKMMRAEVETYDKWLTNDVWGYVIEDQDGNELDSCWGFYGDEYCKQEAIASAKAIAARLAKVIDYQI